MEDILEGLTEEKFEKFSGEMKKVRTEMDKLRAEIRANRERTSHPADVAVPKDVQDKIDDLDARIGGLEKAFRQFLPGLTENIDALAKMIHQMKAERPSSPAPTKEE